MCENKSAGAGELLHELVESGAMATDECYRLCFEDGVTKKGFLEVLLESGYMPLQLGGGRGHKFLLDLMVEACEDDPEHILEGCYKMLQGKAKPGDNFTFGEISAACVLKTFNLPELQVGITHKEGGSFEEFEKAYLEKHKEDDSKGVDEDDSNEKDDSDDEEEVQKRKKRRHK
jgi:hypothetical protein